VQDSNQYEHSATIRRQRPCQLVEDHVVGKSLAS
jgi:hypothetical protein